MPIKRKVILIGGSRGVTIPPSWFELIEKKYNIKVTDVAMEIDTVITITPLVGDREISQES